MPLKISIKETNFKLKYIGYRCLVKITTMAMKYIVLQVFCENNSYGENNVSDQQYAVIQVQYIPNISQLSQKNGKHSAVKLI